MQKIVINDCYGGFSLSHEAIMRYAELKGITLHPWIDDIFKKVYGDRATLSNPDMFIHYTFVPQDEYVEVAEEEKKKPISPGRFRKSSLMYFSDRAIVRTDPSLIQVIEEMKGKANARHSSLKIIEVPEDVEWTIEECAGVEWVSEKHRRWD